MSLFDEEQRNQLSWMVAEKRNQWEADRQRRRAIENEIVEQRGIGRESLDQWEELDFLADMNLKREKWRDGQSPRSYRSRLPFVHARSYLLAMDRLDRLVGVLSNMPDVPERVVEAPKTLRELMPHLREVRNSVAHYEDRSRGLNHREQPLDPKPIDNVLANAPDGGVLAMECLNGNLFGSIMSDGHYGEVELSKGALGEVCRVIQQILNSFKWKGPKRHAPN